jgi:hypothetical protein
MLRAQPQACLSVSAPWIVARMTCSKEVHVELYRLLQLPLEDQVMFAAQACGRLGVGQLGDVDLDRVSVMSIWTSGSRA